MTPIRNIAGRQCGALPSRRDHIGVTSTLVTHVSSRMRTTPCPWRSITPSATASCSASVGTERCAHGSGETIATDR